jgi:hypothetical protein
MEEMETADHKGEKILTVPPSNLCCRRSLDLSPHHFKTERERGERENWENSTRDGNRKKRQETNDLI